METQSNSTKLSSKECGVDSVSLTSLHLRLCLGVLKRSTTLIVIIVVNCSNPPKSPFPVLISRLKIISMKPNIVASHLNTKRMETK